MLRRVCRVDIAASWARARAEMAARAAECDALRQDLSNHFAEVLIFSAAMGAVQWQTSRMTHSIRLRRNSVI